MVSLDEKEKVMVVYYVLCNAGDDKNAYVAYRKYMVMLKMKHISHYEFLESVC